MQTCEDILATKGTKVFTIAETATVLEAVEEMCRLHVGALLVVDDGVPRGIISERDVMTRVVLERLPANQTRVDQAMTRTLVCAELQTTQREAMALMTQKRCRHLPIVRDGIVVGLVSIGDLVRAASREQEFEIRFLSEYIHGEYIHG